MSRIPTAHETWLDLTMIEALSEFAVPVKLPSEWLVRIDTHYLGGGRHLGQWEVADIGILVMFRRQGHLERTKVALLQSKRLYPVEQGFSEDEAVDYRIGFGRLLLDLPEHLAAVADRELSFTAESEYKALDSHETQYKVIKGYEEKYGVPVYYLFYNPWMIPWSVVVPIRTSIPQPLQCDVGCRVVPSGELRKVLSEIKERTPSYKILADHLDTPFNAGPHIGGWRLEDFVDELVTCKTGYVAKDSPDAGLETVFYRRQGPIAAAIAVTIDAVGV
jgi:hypothetical protein